MRIIANFSRVLELSRVRVRRDDLYVTELKTESAKQILRRRTMGPVAELFTQGQVRPYVDIRDYRESRAAKDEKAGFERQRKMAGPAAEVSLLSLLKAAEFLVPNEQPINNDLADLINTVLSPDSKDELAKSLSYPQKKEMFKEYPFSAFQLMGEQEQYDVIFDAVAEGWFSDNEGYKLLAQNYLMNKPNEGRYALLWTLIEKTDFGGEDD